MKIYCRESKRYYREKQFKAKSLHFLYHSIAGRCILKYITLPIFSKAASIYYTHPISRKKIPEFVKQYKIDMDLYERREFHSFDDFFTGKRIQCRGEIPEDSKNLISPADAKLLAFLIEEEKQEVLIKGSRYTVENLLQSKKLAHRFQGGSALLFRLSAEDYHRYAFVENGDIIYKKKIGGRLHTVSSFSRNYPIYTENSREYIVIKNGKGKLFLQMEVGALLIGGIHNHKKKRAYKGREKGFFHFGSSAILVLMEKNAVCIDEDILLHSRMGIETKVKYGESIGEILC